MKLALLNGNRFNPWHFQGYRFLEGSPEITAFRAESEIQQYFHDRDDGSIQFKFERIYFDTEVSNPVTRFRNVVGTNYLKREPRILPFYDRLKDFDLIQSWELFTDWSEQALIAHDGYGVPLVIMVWDNIPFNMEANPIRADIKRRVASGADLFVVHTDRSQRMLAFEGISPERIALIPPGVDTTLFTPGPANRADFDYDEEDFVILFVGWLLPRKGIDFLLQSLHELLKDPALHSRRIKLIVIGSGPGKDRVEALVDRLGLASAVKFMGSVPYNKMPDAYRCANAFVLPSIAMPDWQEQFAMSLIEAMACGTPVVTTYSGAIPEIAGNCTLLCQPNDFASITDALKRLIMNPPLREDLSISGRARAVSRYDLKLFAAQLSKAYSLIT